MNDEERRALTSCNGKQKFPSAHAARETAQRVAGRKRDHGRGFAKKKSVLPGTKTKPVAYHCPVCQHWHWGQRLEQEQAMTPLDLHLLQIAIAIVAGTTLGLLCAWLWP